MEEDAIRGGDARPVNRSVKVSAVTDRAGLEALVPAWNDLLARATKSEIVSSPEWLLAWWDTFGDGRALRCLAMHDGARLVGFAPLLSRAHRYRNVVPFKRLELLASGEDEADETCSDYIGLVAAAGYEEDVVKAFVRALADDALGKWDELVLPSLNGEGSVPQLLKDALERIGCDVTLEEQDTSPFAALPKTWDAYLSSLKQSKRSQLKKALRALDDWGKPEIVRVRTLGQLDAAKDVLERLHRERWGGEGVYRSAKYRAFHDRLMPRLLERGALDLGSLCVRGEPIAAFYNFKWGGRILHYQSGRKLDVPDDIRAGVTMHALLIKDGIESGMTEYDFLAGVSQYKSSLATGARPIVQLRAARKSIVETARKGVEQAIEGARTVRARFQKPAPEASPPDNARIARALDERTKPFYFGPADRGLFGWYHAPKTITGVPIAICPPLGYEAICAYPALRILAERLAAQGHPVLRFDYDGTGDSAGLDSDPNRVRAWVESVGHAIDELRAQSGKGEVALFGVRMGATLAAVAAAERGDVDRLVLWNPVAAGRAYAREMKMFRQFAEQSGELQARPKKEGDTNEESGGFLLTSDTLDAMKKLDLNKLSKAPAPEVLLIGRDDVPDDDKVAKSFGALGANAAYEKLPGYAEMMVAPHKSIFPEAVYERSRAWLGEKVQTARDSKSPTARPDGIVANGVRERVLRFGKNGSWFGVLTEPALARATDAPLVIWSNTAGNYRIGPNRMYVEMGRKLAAMGLSSVRIDVSGIGDSAIWDDEWHNHPYGDQLSEDVRAVVAHLKGEGIATRFGVAGLCSGAFVGYHATKAEPAITSLVMINPQTFTWDDSMSLEVNALARRDASEYYKKRAFSKEAWQKLLSGGVDPRHAIRAGFGRAADLAKSTYARVKAKIPIDPSRGSDVARALDEMQKRGADVLVIFSGGDPGIDNLSENVGSSLPILEKRSGFTVATIEGPDHSFTPLWAQEDLDGVLVGHLAKAFSLGLPDRGDGG